MVNVLCPCSYLSLPSRGLLRCLVLGCLLAHVGCHRLAPIPDEDFLVAIDANAPPAETDQLETRIERVLASGLADRRLSTSDNAAWQIMHGVICYGHDLQIQTPDKGLVSALDYAFHEGVIRGWHLMPGEILPSGRRGVKALLEPGSYIGQGHVDQWIAICAMAGLPATDELVIEGQTFTLRDWAEQARWDACSNPINEASWTLIALTFYFPDDSQWTASDGSTWSWERMVADELLYDLNLSPCGGAHRLVGLARAWQAKERLKLPDSQVWDDARRVIQRSIREIEEMRSGDGSLSSHYLARAGSSRDLGLTLGSSGHLLEFLAVALDLEELQEPWVETAAARLCEIFEATRTVDLDCGACYHALNGLRVYRDRRFGR